MATVTLSQSAYQEIVDRLIHLEQLVTRLVTKMDDDEPPYGTPEWWEWSDRTALEEIRRGNSVTLKNEEDIDKFFENL